MGSQQENNTEKDSQAFRALFVTFFPKVRAMLMRQGADKDTAEEIAQDTLFAVWLQDHTNSLLIKARSQHRSTRLRVIYVSTEFAGSKCGSAFYADLETIERVHGEAIDAQQVGGGKK